METLPSFPVDDVTLDLVEHALAGTLTFDGCDPGDGPRLVGAEFSLSKLLDFLSGYDKTLNVPLTDEDGYEIPDWVEYTGGPIYHPTDIIRALIAEVRRLRTLAGC